MVDWADGRIEWKADGKAVQIGWTRAGHGPTLLLLPAFSSISTRREMRPLQERLAPRFATVAIDWPGFGDLPRPSVDWRPALYRDCLKFILSEHIRPDITVAAGHAAGYVLAHAADDPASTGRLALLSPTWQGPLPTMAGKRMAWFRHMSTLVDLPIIGNAFYRLNVNGPVIGMMARGHVYADPHWLTGDRMKAKRVVTDAEGARHASFRFVAGMLDPFLTREAFLDAASQVPDTIALLQAQNSPRKSKAEMTALAGLKNVSSRVLPRGKLSFYEEFPDDAAAAILEMMK